MSVSTGARLGPYEILGPLGAGGMGEVYRAQDARVDRTVALKVLPEEFFEDPERRGRFEREAKLLASLNHPGIATLHSFEEVSGRHILVMELLEGETLRAALAGAKVSTKKALEWARQIARGLAAAHEKGIVHRDLKPENVFVTRDGRLKILDFGLAKASEGEKGGDTTNLPTATRGTEPGVVMGTLGYMSPEQVKGKPADARSDIFSFGAILYEMLSGQRAFHRDTAAETISAILREDPPDLSTTNQNVPPGLERLVAHCLEKNPEQRFHSAHDLAFDLESVSGASGARAATPSAAGWHARPRAGSAVLLGAGLAAGVLLGAVGARALFRPRASAPPEFQVLTYSGRDRQPSVSPDGKTIVFESSRDGRSRIWVKQVAGGTEAVLTEGPDFSPRFAPDGSAVLFIRTSPEGSAVYRVPLLGGEARRIIAPADEADWAPDGKDIAFVRTELQGSAMGSSLHLVAVDGANERTVASVKERVLSYLRFSPDGRTLAALEGQGTGTNVPKIVLFPVDGKPPRRLETLQTGAVTGFAWNGDGRTLVLVSSVSNGLGGSRTAHVALMDVRTASTRTLFSGLDFGFGVEAFGPGALVLVSAARRSNLREVSLAKPADGGRWLTRGGSIDRQPVYAPDGEWVAFSSNRTANQDLWEVSTKTGAVRRLTEGPADDFDPFFTRDGKRLVFSSNRSGHFEIWSAARDGSGARRVTDDGVDAENASATPDGQWIVYASGNPEKRGIWKARADGSAATRLVAGPAILPEISPDGSLVPYVTVGVPSRRAGNAARNTIAVVRLTDGAPLPFEAVVTGEMPNIGRHRWTPDGRALVFLTADSKGLIGLVRQEVTPGRDTAATRRAVAGFTPDSLTESLGISPDGTRLMVSDFQFLAGLVLAEGVEGIVARPPRGAKP
jgi:Tol biopolymer transport system component/predicted Ser/Thr protein kinase